MILDTRLGNTPRWYLTPPEDYNMRVPDEIRECVVFLGVVVTGETGRIERRLLGTAFIIAMPAQDPSVSHAYLVTAAHLLDKIGANQFFIRANTVSGDADYIYGRLDSPETRWWLHPTNPKNVDIAVMDCALPSDKWSLRAIPATMFLSEDVIAERNIGPGDEVFVTGLFGVMSRTMKNLPIVRVGNIAMLPPELVPTKRGEMEAYLIESRSIGGLSGSPAFVWSQTVVYPPEIQPEKGKGIPIPQIRDGIYLLGLMHGHWDIPVEDRNDARPRSVEEMEGVNMGIAIVVPARKIMEVLNQPELVADRARVDEEYTRQYVPTMDTMPEK